MTANVAPRPRRARARKTEPAIVDTLPIGEIDQTVFSCPACARPLAMGAKRCPGCGTRLLIGVQASKVAVFAATGASLGLLIGIAGAALLSAVAAPAVSPTIPAASAAPIVSAPPVASVAPSTGTGNGTGNGPTIPAASKVALQHALQIDVQLMQAQASLEAALVSPTFDPMDVARTLRTISAGAFTGLEMTAHIETWDRSDGLGGRLSELYAAIHATAGDGLDASVRNEAAYREAATALVALLGDLPALDATARDLADEAGIKLPPAP